MHAEAGHHLVEHQQRAVAVAERAQAVEETRRRRDAVHVAGHRLDDHRGDVVREGVEQPPDRIEIVVGGGEGEFGQGGGHAGRGRHAEGQQAGAGLHQQGVAMAVVAALELQDARAAGGAAGEAQGAHGRLGAAGAQPHHVQMRHAGAEQLRHRDLGLGGRAVGEAHQRLRAHRLDHRRMLVAEDHRAPGADVIDVAAAVGIGQPRAVGRGDETRSAADRLERPHRRVDAAGDRAARTREQGFGDGDGTHCGDGRAERARV